MYDVFMTSQTFLSQQNVWKMGEKHQNLVHFCVGFCVAESTLKEHSVVLRPRPRRDSSFLLSASPSKLHGRILTILAHVLPCGLKNCFLQFFLKLGFYVLRFQSKSYCKIFGDLRKWIISLHRVSFEWCFFIRYLITNI